MLLTSSEYTLVSEQQSVIHWLGGNVIMRLNQCYHLSWAFTITNWKRNNWWNFYVSRTKVICNHCDWKFSHYRNTFKLKYHKKNNHTINTGKSFNQTNIKTQSLEVSCIERVSGILTSEHTTQMALVMPTEMPLYFSLIRAAAFNYSIDFQLMWKP